MPSVRLDVLGPLTAHVDGEAVDLGGPRQRSVIALLAAAQGRVVPVHRLLDEIWAGDPPRAALSSLQAYVSNLRKALEPSRERRSAATVLVSQAPGYLLPRGAAEIDADRFASRAGDGRRLLAEGRPGTALAALDEALGLWRGPAYADLAEDGTLAAEAARLESLRIAAQEDRLDALLQVGEAGPAVAELERLVAEHPLRERLWQLLALGLYRCERQADALGALREARRILVDELGLDPTPALQQLEADMLAQEPALAWTPPADTGPATATPAPAPVEPAAQAAASPPAFAPPPPPGLVGREQPLAHLRSRLGSALAGDGAVVLVTGDPGIGKTRLVEAAAAELGESVSVAWGRCQEGAGNAAFWPWVEALRSVLADVAPPRTARATLAHLLPELAEEPLAAAMHLDGEAARLRLYDAAVQLLTAAAAQRPVIVVLEDLHWADASSLRLLQYAAERIRDQRVVIVATLRVAEVDKGSSLEQALAGLARLHFPRVSLDGLTLDAVARLVEQATGQPVDERLADVVLRRTDGNPFFILELARLLDSEGFLDAERATSAEIPDGVRAVVRRRLSRLPDDAQSLLTTASVIGRSFDIEVLEAVSDLDGDDVLDLVDTALVHGLVEEQAEQVGRYRFSHALVRETLAEGLSRLRQARLHGRIAEALEASGVADAELAMHYAEAAGVSDELASKAVRYAIGAARRADEQWAYDEALAQWQRAEAVLDRRAVGDELKRYEVSLGLGIARRRTGDLMGSRAALEQAASIARAQNDVDRMAIAGVSLGGEALWHWREYGDVDRTVIELLEDSLAALPVGPLRAQVLANLAVEVFYAWELERADQLSAEAVEIARAAGLVPTLARVLNCRYLAIWCAGREDDRLEAADEILGLDPSEISPEMELTGRFLRACALMELRRVDEADREITRCDLIAGRLRHTSTAVQLGWWHAMRATLSGRLPDAERYWEYATEVHGRTSVAGHKEAAGTVGLAIDLPRKEATELLPFALAYVEMTPQPAYRCMVALALAWSGRRDEAAALIRRVPQIPPERDWASLAVACLRTEVLVECGIDDHLQETYEALLPYADRLAMYGSFDCPGSVQYYLGRAASALGKLNEAAVHFEGARTVHEEVRAPLWQARTEWRHAEVLLALGEYDRAAELLVHSEELADSRGAHGLALQARRARAALTQAVGTG